MFKKLEDIDVWKKGCRLAVDIYKFTDSKPFQKDWGLRDQLRRASVLIASNIAEGYERNSQNEFKRFLLIAKGSNGELRTQLYIVKALGISTEIDADRLINECKEISSMLQALVSKLTTTRK